MRLMCTHSDRDRLTDLDPPRPPHDAMRSFIILFMIIALDRMSVLKAESQVESRAVVPKCWATL